MWASVMGALLVYLSALVKRCVWLWALVKRCLWLWAWLLLRGLP